MYFTIVYAQALGGRLLRRAAERINIDTSDEGFTTVEKVVLTGIAVLIAVGAGAALKGKVTTLIGKISDSFE
jgi:uridylate kinase